MPYIAPHSPVADWRCVPQGHGYGNYFDAVTGTWATVTRTTPKTARVAADKLVDVPAGYLALEPWSLHKTGGVGLAAIIEEARTNYLLNSYGAANDGSRWTSYWSVPSGSQHGPITTAIEPESPYGTSAYHVAYNGVAEDANASFYIEQVVAPGLFAAGDTATFSFYAKGHAINCAKRIEVLAFDASSALLGLVSASTGSWSSEWTRETLTYANLPAGTYRLRVRVGGISIKADSSFECTFSACQLEKGSFATSYIPTTAAAVTRNADSVTIPTTRWDSSAGTWVNVCGATAGGVFMAWQTDTNNRVLTSTSGGRDYSYFGAVWAYSPASGTTAPRVVASAFAVGFVGRQYRNGVRGTDSSVVQQMGVLPATANLGSNNAGAAHINGALHRLVVYDTALTDEQLAAADMTTDLLAGLDTARVTNEVTL